MKTQLPPVFNQEFVQAYDYALREFYGKPQGGSVGLRLAFDPKSWATDLHTGLYQGQLSVFPFYAHEEQVLAYTHEPDAVVVWGEEKTRKFLGDRINPSTLQNEGRYGELMNQTAGTYYPFQLIGEILSYTITIQQGHFQIPNDIHGNPETDKTKWSFVPFNPSNPVRPTGVDITVTDAHGDPPSGIQLTYLDKVLPRFLPFFTPDWRINVVNVEPITSYVSHLDTWTHKKIPMVVLGAP